MDLRIGLQILANFAFVAGLIVYGLRLFAEYHSRGKWAKNVSALLAGIGMLLLALAFLITPQNAEVLTLIARTQAHRVLFIGSNILLLAAIAAFGIINYSKPGRLLREREIEKGLKGGLPDIP